MTTNLAATYPNELPTAVLEPDGLTLVGEHAQLLQGVHRRVWPVLALIDAGTWPTPELHTLVGFLRASLLRQASDEEVLLFPAGAATPFSELTAQHARLHTLTERLAQAACRPRREKACDSNRRGAGPLRRDPDLARTPPARVKRVGVSYRTGSDPGTRA